MSITNRLEIAFKSLRELGPKQVGFYAYYQFSLYSGLLRLKTPPENPKFNEHIAPYQFASGMVHIPSPEELARVIGDGASALISEANDINNGKVRLFGGPPQELNLLVPIPLQHWTVIAKGKGHEEIEDIKFIWEPARFTWVYPLARAYKMSQDESYVQTFWREFEAFADFNITNLGPNWASAQEIAMRLIALTFAQEVFSSSSETSSQRINLLVRMIVDHANRIPATLAYARAQNNNHLLTEAAGLYTAGMYLPEHPNSAKWRQLGWKWFNHAVQSQIFEDGTYIQHSTNYHRLMLQTALWILSLEGSLPDETLDKLVAATRWLLALTDPENGHVPNLGHNDGTYLQPLSSCSYHDYRPVLQSAALAFMNELPFPPGPWDEISMWLGFEKNGKSNSANQKNEITSPISLTSYSHSSALLRNETNHSWVNLRVSQYRSRPAHADQLHLDLWWQGMNLAQDAGTYLYNASPPWDNSLAGTEVHNTITINEQDQMKRAGRFLWLDWSQAEIVQEEIGQSDQFVMAVAQHDGYKKTGIIHQRTVKTGVEGSWLIEDRLFPVAGNRIRQWLARKSNTSEKFFRLRLHWLLPDWSWELSEIDEDLRTILRLRSPLGWLELSTSIEPATPEITRENPPRVQLVRAGELVSGSGDVSPISGWSAPTYGYKIPALSLSITVDSPLPAKFMTQWDLPGQL